MDNRRWTYSRDNTLVMAGILACARQRQLSPFVDLANDTERFYPISREIYKQTQQANNDFAVNKPTTISISNLQSYKIDHIWFNYQLPAIVAKDLGDKAEYDSLPGINAISKITTQLAAYAQTETTCATAIIQLFLRQMGYDCFCKQADDNWGGFAAPATSYRPAHRGYLQKLTGLNRTTLSNNNAENEIFPAVNIRLPVPSSLLWNKEKYNFALSLHSPLDFQITFNSFQSILSRTNNNMFLPELQGQIDVYFEVLEPVDIANFYNNLPYSNKPDLVAAPYYFIDRQSVEFQVRSFPFNGDLKVPIKAVLLRRLQAMLTLKDWESSRTYPSTTVEQSAANHLAAMFASSVGTMNPIYTVDLGVGTWVATGTATSGQMTISGWVVGGTSCQINWNRSPGVVYSVTINSLLPWGSYGSFFLDLSTYTPSIGPSGFITVTQPGMFFMCSAFTLDIRTFSPLNPTVDTMEIPSVSFGTAKKLMRGYYSFNPAVAPPNNNQHAFYNITNIKRSPLLTCDDNLSKQGFAFDFFASQPIPQAHQCNPLVVRDFIKVNRNQHNFYDLDCKWPIELSQAQIEMVSGSSETLIEELNYTRQLPYFESTRWDMTFDRQYNWQADQIRDTNGYKDCRFNELSNLILKPKNIHIYYDGVELTDVGKVYYTDSRDFFMTVFFWTTRAFKFVDNELRSMMGDQYNTLELNQNLVENMLKPLGVYEGEFVTRNMNPPPASSYQPQNYPMRQSVVQYTRPSPYNNLRSSMYQAGAPHYPREYVQDRYSVKNSVMDRY